MHPDAETKRWCRIIHERVHQMSAMVEELLEFSRGKHQLNLQSISLAELMERFVLLHQDYLRQQKVELDLKSLDVPIKADTDKLLRVLQNLVCNAAEALKDDGTGNIECNLRETTASGRRRIDCLPRID